MVALRSRRQDRSLIVALWLLTLPVIGLGVALVNPILIFWGALGALGAVFITRIHVRDTRTRTRPVEDVGGVDEVDKVGEESSR